MSSLPNPAGAILDLRKIEEYCLSPTHPRGRHKARVFREALGLGQVDAEWLRAVVLERIWRAEAVELGGDDLGARWRVDIRVARHDKAVVVRTIWIVRTGEQMPRFVTCWVM